MSIGGGWGQHKCGLTGVGAICWGRGGFGQLGDGTVGKVGNGPLSVALQENWADVSTGRLITCALNHDGEAFCWGYNQFGEVGDTLLPFAVAQLTPNRVVGGIRFKTIVAGWLHSCGISTAGTVHCWGDNKSGQLGIGVADSIPHPHPAPIASSLEFRRIALSARATCAVSTDDQLLCWGYNGVGQLGDGTTELRTSPTPVAVAKKWKDVAMSSGFVEGTTAAAPAGLIQGGIAHACAIDDAGAAYCWGWNGAGQLGDGSTTTRLVPTPVNTTIPAFSSIALGSAYSCGMWDAAVYCWGSNTLGQLGTGSGVADATQPVKAFTPWR
jgi:alpha-tubulin suppressor-like RCC1 family protein